MTLIDSDELIEALKSEIEREMCQGEWYSGRKAGLDRAIERVEDMTSMANNR